MFAGFSGKQFTTSEVGFGSWIWNLGGRGWEWGGVWGGGGGMAADAVIMIMMNPLLMMMMIMMPTG